MWLVAVVVVVVVVVRMRYLAVEILEMWFLSV